MAEVPEVETIVRDLKSAVVGRQILGAEVILPATVRFPEPDIYTTLLQQRTIKGAERRAKHILMPLSGDLILEIHFMLFGTLVLGPAGGPRKPDVLVVFSLDQDQEIHLRDRLGYARTALAPPDELISRLNIDTLGPDALDPSFSADVIAERLTRRKGVLKTILLNQRIISGLGNRDADESMWLAQIDPRRSPNSLSYDECVRLHDGICTVLEEGIKQRGTQPDLFGQMGKAKHRRYIFERTNFPCPRCETPIAHMRIGGRNTHYCPGCQR